MKVLIVEDHDDAREMLRMMVCLKGCEVVEAADGLAACAAADGELPDLILMDLNLPKLDGWEATRRIVAGERTRRIPVVAVSAQCRGAWGERALAAGARECVEKPLDFGVVEDLLARYAPGDS